METFVTLFAFILGTTTLFLTLDTYVFNTTAGWSANVTSAYTNISLSLSGRCKRITYCGVDTRMQLLSDFHVRGVPKKRYYPQMMNWARVALIREVMERCNQTEWVLYSDSDAYVGSWRVLRKRLAFFSNDTHLVFQNGMWVVNSGLHAWRNSPMSWRLLDKWEASYRVSKDFFAEQRGLLRIYEHNKRACAHRPNGFLGWHVKGEVPYKTELSATARRFAARTGPALLYTMVIAHIVIVVVAAFPASGDGKHKLVTAARAACRVYIHCITSARLAAVAIIISVSVAAMLWPTGPRKAGRSLSAGNYIHLLPNGRVMLGLHYWINEYGHYQKPGPRWHIFKVVSVSRWGVLALFTLAEIVEWSCIVWIYLTLLVYRWLLTPVFLFGKGKIESLLRASIPKLRVLLKDTSVFLGHQSIRRLNPFS